MSNTSDTGEYYLLTGHKGSAGECIFVGRVYSRPESDAVHVSRLMTPDEIVVWQLEGGELDDQ